MSANERSVTLRRIVDFRRILGFLGEKTQSNWWSSSFYEASSTRFLEPVFSRTAHLAQYHGAVESARRFHDENLSVGSFHIFRLPEEIEQDLHEMVQTRLIDLFDPALIIDQGTALNALSKSCTGADDGSVGPVLVGTIDELWAPALLNKVGAIYRTALSSGDQALPYLVA